jgi:YggT family protein
MLTILVLLGYLLRAYYYILIIYVLMSWIPELRGSKFHQVIHNMANPYMRIFRGFLVFGMMDFTPILGFILYQIGLNYYAEMIHLMQIG